VTKEAIPWKCQGWEWLDALSHTLILLIPLIVILVKVNRRSRIEADRGHRNLEHATMKFGKIVFRGSPQTAHITWIG
jgi:hypothetical protein